MTALPIACPAATEVDPPGTGPTIVCGVLANANDAAHDGVHAAVDALFDVASNPRTVLGFCAGSGIPGSSCSYTSCAIWRAEKQRGRDRKPLADEQAVRQGAIREQG